MNKTPYDKKQLHELLYQALETELGGIKIYETAITCAVNADLKKEWTNYLEQTKTHREVLMKVFSSLGLDIGKMTPGRAVVGHIGRSLVEAMEMAKQDGNAAAAQLVAGECVVLAETKDHMNWELIGHLAGAWPPEPRYPSSRQLTMLSRKTRTITCITPRDGTRELWIDSLGLPAVLPPPEEIKDVETAIGAARAEQSRDQMLKGKK